MDELMTVVGGVLVFALVVFILIVVLIVLIINIEVDKLKDEVVHINAVLLLESENALVVEEECE